MEAATQAEHRRKLRSRRADPLQVRLGLVDESGAERLIEAALLDASEDGLGLELRQALASGATVSVAAGSSLLPVSEVRLCPHARVEWCRGLSGGRYRVGLSIRHESLPPIDTGPAEGDHYEVLQVNPKATADTIHRVYRLLAQQYHPDNQETGDEQMFRAILAAYRVLSDPERRAGYDQRYYALRQTRWQIYNSPESVQGIRGEQRRRFGVLRALYTKRMQDPRQPDMSIPDLEGLLGVPREHLEFTLWYLKERGHIGRSDNIRYSITAAGVEHTEQLEESLSASPVARPLLEQPASGR